MSSSGSFFDELGQAARDKPRRDRPGGRVAWWTIVGVVLLVAAGYVGLAWFANDMAPRRASVEGVDIGGMTASQVTTTLHSELGPRLAEPVVLTHRGEKVSIQPESAGLSIDYAETVRRAGAGSAWTPRQLWDHYTGDNDTAAVLDVEQAAMSRVLDGVTDKFDALAVEGTLDFSTGRAEPVYGKPGLRVDREATVAVLKETIFDPAEPELPVESREPYISGPAVRQALTEFGRPAMSAPIALLIGPERVVVPTTVVGQSLTMIPNEGTLKPLLDGRRLMELIEPRMETVGEKARNGSVKVVDGRLVTIPARLGAAWDDAELEQGVLAALVKPRGERRVTLQAAISEPEVDDVTVAAWGVKRQVGNFGVDLGEADDASRRAVAALDNTRIPAGKTISLLEELGDGAHDSTVGAVGAALFTTAYRAGFEVVEQTSPARRDGRFPAGFDIRVDAGHDLELRNPTPYSVLVSATLQGKRLELSLWSTPHAEVSIKTSEKCTTRDGRALVSTTVTRKVTVPGTAANTDRLEAAYPARRDITCPAGQSPAPPPADR